MTKKVVPFGKYKGRSIEELEADRPYAEWLSGQDWFKQRFAELYSLLLLNRDAPETPEHNAMQARFLDLVYCNRLLSVAGFEPTSEKAEFEKYGFDVSLREWHHRIGVEIKPALGDDYPAALRQIIAAAKRWDFRPILLVGSYNGSGATWDQVVAIFAASGIKAILAAALD